MNGRRRQLSLLGLGALGAGVLALRPGDSGSPHAPYFSGIASALRRAGIATPTIVLDRARLHDNVARIVRNIGGRQQLRVVAKSLPCVALLDEILRQTGTRSLMVFSLPHLLQLAQGERDLLLGKPLPASAAARFYQQLQPGRFAPQRQLQWLVDTPQRLKQYALLARGQRLEMRINIEIDVGLHRGGVNSPEIMAEMLAVLQSEPLLHWSGLMGYDAHITKIPDIGAARDKAKRHARTLYAGYVEQIGRTLGAEMPQRACFNAGGSPTYRLFDSDSVENELSVGSAMVKPGDFDTPLLDDLLPAAFIATPVIKALPEFAMPYGVEWSGDLARAWDINQRRAYFIYGGNWLADPVSPAGLAPSALYGKSSNQQLLLGSGAQRLAPDDFVFFRPRQSEAVLQQLGDIALYDGGEITQMWSPFPAAG